MTARILKPNGGLIFCSAFCQLTPEEIKSPVQQALRDKFNVSIAERLGTEATTAEFTLEYLTPEWEPHKDDCDETTGFPDYPDKIFVPTLEQGGGLLHAEIMLPRGGDMARGRMVA